MEAISMNVASAVNPAAPQQMQGMPSGVNGDFLQQLICAMQIGNADAFLEILGANINMDEKMFDGMMKNNSEAMQMMMAQLMGIISNINYVDVENNQEPLNTVETNFQELNLNNLFDKTVAQPKEQSQEQKVEQKPFMEILSVETNVKTNKEQKTDENIIKSFDQNIEQAKRIMGETKIKAVSQSDLAELGGFAQEAPVINTSSITVKDNLSEISPKIIMEQIENGIKEGIKLKNDNIVIKLHPEGLGQVTVKMTDVNGKISLDIITASQYAHNALNSEIESLKESLRQYNAEVNSLVTANGFNFAQENGQNNQGGNQQPNHNRNVEYYDDVAYTNDMTAMEEYVRALSEALTRYV